jgi:hypothetical protein
MCGFRVSRQARCDSIAFLVWPSTMKRSASIFDAPRMFEMSSPSGQRFFQLARGKRRQCGNVVGD